MNEASDVVVENVVADRLGILILGTGFLAWHGIGLEVFVHLNLIGAVQLGMKHIVESRHCRLCLAYADRIGHAFTHLGLRFSMKYSLGFFSSDLCSHCSNVKASFFRRSIEQIKIGPMYRHTQANADLKMRSPTNV